MKEKTLTLTLTLTTKNVYFQDKGDLDEDRGVDEVSQCIF